MTDNDSASWTVQIRKYDQRPHITLPVVLVADDGESILMRLPAGSIVEHHTRGWARPAERCHDLYFWRTHWYNVYASYEADGSLRGFYCNVALPPVIENHTLIFVDLDIDVRIWPDGRYELLDLDEFRAHTVEFEYPAEVQRAAYDAMLDILIRWRARRSPFDLLR